MFLFDIDTETLIPVDNARSRLVRLDATAIDDFEHNHQLFQNEFGYKLLTSKKKINKRVRYNNFTKYELSHYVVDPANMRYHDPTYQGDHDEEWSWRDFGDTPRFNDMFKMMTKVIETGKVVRCDFIVLVESLG